MTNMSPDDLASKLRERNWVGQTNIFGLWVVGPETEDGMIAVVGMGRTLTEAFEIAERSKDN